MKELKLSDVERMKRSETPIETELRLKFGKRLREIRLSRNMSQEELAKLFGTTKQVISYYEMGKRAPVITTAMEYARILGMSLDELAQIKIDTSSIPGMTTIPYSPPRAQIPVIGLVRCGEGGLAMEEPLGYEGADVANAEEYFYLRATGESMEPRVYEGDYVLVHRQPDIESGELAVVIVNGEEGTLKKIIKKQNTIILQPFNPTHAVRVFTGEEINNIIIVGKAVELLRKM